MSTAVDTNVLIDLLGGQPAAAERARVSLADALSRGAVIAAPVVYAELLAFPDRAPGEVDLFLADVGITVEWELAAAVWRHAGEAYAAYAKRRVRSGGGAPRRILADFIVGAHASQYGTLLTRDLGFYRQSFPNVSVREP